MRKLKFPLLSSIAIAIISSGITACNSGGTASSTDRTKPITSFKFGENDIYSIIYNANYNVTRDSINFNALIAVLNQSQAFQQYINNKSYYLSNINIYKNDIQIIFTLKKTLDSKYYQPQVTSYVNLEVDTATTSKILTTAQNSNVNVEQQKGIPNLEGKIVLEKSTPLPSMPTKPKNLTKEQLDKMSQKIDPKYFEIPSNKIYPSNFSLNDTKYQSIETLKEHISNQFLSSKNLTDYNLVINFDNFINEILKFKDLHSNWNSSIDTSQDAIWKIKSFKITQYGSNNTPSIYIDFFVEKFRSGIEPWVETGYELKITNEQYQLIITTAI